MVEDILEETILHFRQKMLEWGKHHLRKFPWRETANRKKILIAEIFLQRTPAERVADRYDDLLEAFLDVPDISEIEMLKSRFNDMGLTKRVAWLVHSLRIIEDEYDGEIPSDYDCLRELPGVGEYVAKAILSLGFGQDVAMVDRAVSRVIHRVFLISRIDDDRGVRESVDFVAKKLVPNGNAKKFNLSLIDFSSQVCMPTPKCYKCPFTDICCCFTKHKKREEPI